MPDISMCTGKCVISDYCYRYTAKPNPYGQTYSFLEEVCVPNDYKEFIPDEKRIKEDEERLSLDNVLLKEIHKLMDETNKK